VRKRCLVAARRAAGANFFANVALRGRGGSAANGRHILHGNGDLVVCSTRRYRERRQSACVPPTDIRAYWNAYSKKSVVCKREIHSPHPHFHSVSAHIG